MTTSTTSARVTPALQSSTPKRSLRLRPIYLLVLAWVVGVVGPYLWMALTSITPLSELHGDSTTILPRNPSLQAYGRLLTQTGFLRNIANSAIVAASVVVIVVFCSLLAGTALSRYRFRGRRAVLYGILLLQLFPSILLLVPLYIELKNLRLLDSLVGLILVYSAFAMSFSTWLMKGFVDQIPGEIEEAALIDGCTRWQAFIHVMLPLSKPGIAAAGTYAFIYSWNEFIFALTFTSSNSAKTVPVGLSQFIGENIIRWDFLTSGGVIAAIPILIGFMFAQRGLIAGLASGAVKG